MSITQCQSCGYCSSHARNCAGCGGTGTMLDVDEEKERLRKSYLTVADALAAESESPEQLASVARSLRAEVALLREALRSYARKDNWARTDHVGSYDAWIGTSPGWEIAEEALQAKP